MTSPVLDLAKTDLSQADVLIVDGNILDLDGSQATEDPPVAEGTFAREALDSHDSDRRDGGRIADDLEFKLGWNFG